MKWIKAGTIGALGSLVMFALIMFGIHGAGIAPFNLPPSAAFLEKLGINVGPFRSSSTSDTEPPGPSCS